MEQEHTVTKTVTIKDVFIIQLDDYANDLRLPIDTVRQFDLYEDAYSQGLNILTLHSQVRRFNIRKETIRVDPE